MKEQTMMNQSTLVGSNRFRNQTTFVPRPSRTDPKWRYANEGELLRAMDEWDQAEASRQWVDAQVATLAANAKKRADEEARATKAREDSVVETVFRERYLSAGGDPVAFERDLPELRREHAKRVALGLDQPINSLDTLKRELKALRGHRLAAPDSGLQP
jgi:hypothetical protein